MFGPETSAKVVLINGASACSIYWIVQSFTTISPFTILEGNLICNSSIVCDTDLTNAHSMRLISLSNATPSCEFTNETIVLNSGCVCFAKGTQIKTIDGYKCIENLHVDDSLITIGTILNNSQFCPNTDKKYITKKIKWIGKYTINNMTNDAFPICIKKDAMGSNIPMCDTYLSKLHSVTVDNKMTCIANLINGKTIYQDINFSSVDYYHIELDDHCVILANGLAAETLLGETNKYRFN